eukprot:gene31966-38652_t
MSGMVTEATRLLKDSPNAGIRILRENNETILLWKTANVAIASNQHVVRPAAVSVEEWLRIKKCTDPVIFTPLDVKTAGIVVVSLNSHLSNRLSTLDKLQYTYTCLLETSEEKFEERSQLLQLISRCRTDRNTQLSLVKLTVNGHSSSAPDAISRSVEKMGFRLYLDNGKPSLALTGVSIVIDGDNPHHKSVNICEDVSIPNKFIKALRREELRFSRLVETKTTKGKADNKDDTPRSLVSFRNLELSISHTGLRPRNSSGVLVNAGINILRLAEKREAVRVLDIGCGSGSLLLALLNEAPRDCECQQVYGVGIDINEDDLAMARLNAARLQLSNTSTGIASVFLNKDFTQMHLTWPWLELSQSSGQFDLIVCNPPFLSEVAVRPRVTSESERCLVGGADGLDAYRAICQSITSSKPRLLSNKGKLLFQLPGGERAVERVLRAIQDIKGWKVVEIIADQRGVNRCLVLEQS